ncbi:MAG: DUF2726 domain-containing protein [Lentisphaerae bacterium]|nr:DUF2726 domain-containing protein [Lentisphaerota bacterium]
MNQSTNPGCLFAILKLFGLGGGKPGALPYRLRDDFLSPAEVAFYRALAAVVGDGARIVFKVNLGDLFFVVNLNKSNYAYRGRISQKHVDFLLCDPRTLKPVAGIELDDASHGRRDRQARDAFVDRVFEAAGLPLLHVPCRREYAPQDIRDALAPILSPETGPQPGADGRAAPAEAPAAQHAMPEAVAAPLCPKCGVSLVLRKGAQGPFYGCPNYPRCRQTAKL